MGFLRIHRKISISPWSSSGEEEGVGAAALGNLGEGGAMRPGHSPSQEESRRLGNTRWSGMPG